MTIAIGLLKMLLELASAGKCGAVDVVMPPPHGARVRIFLDDGEIVFAEEGSVGETLGRILVREKVITDDQYAAAIEWCAEARARGASTKLGGVLVELGYIKPKQLDAALSAQVRQKVVRALGWPSARVSFVECHGALDVGARHPTQLEPLVLAALRRVEPSHLDELFDQARGRFVALRSDRAAATATFERLASFRMQPDEDAFARSLAGAHTVDELLSERGERGDRAVVLAALLLTDCLDLHASPKAPRDKPLPAPRPRRSLVPAEPAPPSSRRSGAALLSSARRRTSIEPPPPSSQRGAQRLAARLRIAHDSARTLAAKPATKAPPELPSTARLLAERAFQRGRQLARANRLADALLELRAAQGLHAAPEYDAWAAWAALRTEKDPSDAHAEALRDAAERALAQDPSFGFGLFALGYLALRSGDVARGKELLVRARALDPETVDSALDVKLRQPTPPAARTAGEVRSLAPPLGSTPQIAVAASSQTEGVDDELEWEAPPPDTNRDFPGPKSAPPEPRSLPPRPTPRPKPPPLPPRAARPTEAQSNEVPEIREPAAAAEIDVRATEKSIRAQSSGESVPEAPRAEEDAVTRTEEIRAPARPSASSPWPREANRTTPDAIEPTPAAFSTPPPERRVRTSALLVVVGIAAAAIVVVRSLPTTDPVVELRGGAATDPAPSNGPVATFAETEPLRTAPLEDATVAEIAPATTVDAAAIAIVDAAPTAEVDAALTAVVDAAPIASASDVRDAEPEIPAGRGLLELPLRANGHRIYFEGRVVGEPPAIVTVPCGRHMIRVGSAGRDQLVDVPCGGRVSVAYP